MTRFAIELTDRLLRSKRDFRFVGRRSGELDFQDDRAGERLVLTDLELAEEVAAGKAVLVKQSAVPGALPQSEGRPTADLSQYPAAERAAARRRLAYVLGARAAGLTGRAANAALAASVEDTAAQLGDSEPPHFRSLRRWLRGAQATPTAGRYVTRQHAKGNRACRLDPDVVAIIEAKIDGKYLARPPITFDRLHAHVVTAIGKRNAAQQQAAPLRAPSLDAVRRRVLLRSPRDVAAAREGEARARQRFDMVHGQPDPEAPLDLVELDHTVSDMLVVCGRTFLPFGRATLAASICRCTRMPVGIYLGFEPPSVHSVMQCLRNGMLPKTYLDEKVSSGEWNIKHGWPVCGRPRTLLLDRGMENLGGDLDAFAGEVGINLRFAPRKSPWFKGAIERFFRTLNQGLLHEQRGTTFSNVVARDDYDPARNAVITLEELLYVLHKWLLDVYACTIHRGMRDVPARLWGELTILHPIQPVSSIADLDMLFGRVEHRVLQRTGVTFEHVRFASEELVSLLADARFRKACPDRKIRFRYDPADLGMIRAYDPCEARYIEVPAWDQGYAKGLSIWQHRQIVSYKNRRNAGAADFEGCARAKVEIAAVFEAAMADRRTGSRKKAARHDGVGRLAPAGSSHETTPQGSVEAMRRGAAPPRARTKPAKSSKAIAAAPVPSLQPDDREEDIYAALGIAR